MPNLYFTESHYLKHHPFYEFRNFEEFHVDGYRHWLHGRADYYLSETYPGELSPWEMGSKFHHCFYLSIPVLSFYFLTNEYVSFVIILTRFASIEKASEAKEHKHGHRGRFLAALSLSRDPASSI